MERNRFAVFEKRVEWYRASIVETLDRHVVERTQALVEANTPLAAAGSGNCRADIPMSALMNRDNQNSSVA